VTIEKYFRLFAIAFLGNDSQGKSSLNPSLHFPLKSFSNAEFQTQKEARRHGVIVSRHADGVLPARNEDFADQALGGCAVHRFECRGR
jgi:hypothetical protein